MPYSDTYMKEKEGYKMEGEAIYRKSMLCAFGLDGHLGFYSSSHRLFCSFTLRWLFPSVD